MFVPEKTPQTISISSRDILRIFIVIGMGILLWNIHATVLVILVAVILSVCVSHIASNGLFGKLPRTLSTVIVYVLFVGSIVTIFTLFIPTFFQEAGHLLSFNGDTQSVVDVLKTISNSNSKNTVKLVTDVQNSLQDFTPSTWLFVTNGFGGILNAILVVVLSLYLSLENNPIERFLRAFLSEPTESRWISVWRRSERKIAKWFSGQLIMAIILALCTYFGLWLVDLPYALIVALFSAVMSLVPFGMLIAGLAAILLTVLDGSLTAGLFVAVWFTVLKFLEDYLLLPYIIHRSTGLPPLIALISLIVGVAAFGLIGLILAVPAAIVILEIVRDYEESKKTAA